MTISDCEACGWMAAIASMLAFGSFAAPINTPLGCSASWTRINLQSVGIVSGLFWVPGGVATVVAVKYAGLVDIRDACCSDDHLTWRHRDRHRYPFWLDFSVSNWAVNDHILFHLDRVSRWTLHQLLTSSSNIYWIITMFLNYNDYSRLPMFSLPSDLIMF